jgi:16S rRNA (uracil1498-N3)-methyltransferase
MRISRVHTDLQLATGLELPLDAETSHYLGTVLRLRPNALVHLFNARDGEFAASLIDVSKGCVTVRIDALQRAPQPPALAIHLGLGLSRGDRMDFGIQKSTELGAAQITPLYSQFGEVRLTGDRADNKLRHWRKIAINAAEQCGRLDVPVINPPQSLVDWHDGLEEMPRLLLDPSGSTSLTGLNTRAGLAVMIGPEGGFSDEEISWGSANGFAIVALGSRILRTETAPIAALAILQHLYGDM